MVNEGSNMVLISMNCSLLHLKTHKPTYAGTMSCINTHTHIYIYIYIYICAVIACSSALLNSYDLFGMIIGMYSNPLATDLNRLS